MATGWYRAFHAWIRTVWFTRVEVLHGERLPRSGAVLYLGLHRNGAVDGFVYHRVAPRAIFLIASQLRKGALARLFFAGIEVVRGKDEGDREGNEGALRACVDRLKAGDALFILPEGTSTLGPRHLPFKLGAVQILAEALAAGAPVTVVPLGIHYERAWEFRSAVELVVGEPIPTGDPPASLRDLRRRVKEALEALSADFPDAAAQEDAERVATLLWREKGRPRFETLRAPPAAGPALRELDGATGVLRYRGLPLVPAGSALPGAVMLLLAGPVVAAAILLNAPPFFAAAWAGRTFPDGPNVVALWKILVGMPLLLAWVPAAIGGAAFAGGWRAVAGYAAVSLLGLLLYDPVKRLGVESINALRAPGLRKPMAALRAACAEPIR